MNWAAVGILEKTWLLIEYFCWACVGFGGCHSVTNWCLWSWRWSEQNQCHLKAKHKDTMTDNAVTHWRPSCPCGDIINTAVFFCFFSPTAMTEKLGLKKSSLIWWAEPEGKVARHESWHWGGDCLREAERDAQRTIMSSDESKHNQEHRSISLCSLHHLHWHKKVATPHTVA